MKRTIFIIMILLISSTLIYVDMLNKKNAIEKVSPYPEIRLYYDAFPGFMLIPLAKELGYYDDENINVSLIKFNDDKQFENERSAHHIDAYLDFASQVVSDSLVFGNDYQIVLATDISLDSDAIVSKKGAPPLDLAKPANIAAQEGYYYFIRRAMLDKQGSLDSLKQITILSPEEGIATLKNGRADYLAVYEPYASEVIASGGRTEYTARANPGVIIDSLIFSREYIEKNPEAVKGFARAYFKAYDYWKENPAQSAKITAKYFDMEQDALITAVKRVEFLGLDANVEAMVIAPSSRSLYGHVRAAYQFLPQDKVSASSINNVDDLIYQKAIIALRNERYAQ